MKLREMLHLGSQQRTVDKFHMLYYYSYERTLNKTFWLGVPCLKCPLDLWVYQEIIFTLKPDIIIESGTFAGGTTLFLASLCDLIDNGKIISIDIEEKPNRPKHQRITYLLGSSISEGIVEQVKNQIKTGDKVIVILDSDHTKDHVLQELRTYGKLVTPGSYIIVEDSNINGHPIWPACGPGPMEAIKEFLTESKDFVVDQDKEKFFLTFNPNGYLKKVK